VKATLNLSCELEDIPQTVGDWLSNLHLRQVDQVTSYLNVAKTDCRNGNAAKGLETIDQTRQLLAKIDEHLMDFSSILAGYIKAKADMDAGIGPPPPPPPEPDIIDEVIVDEIEEGDEEQSAND